MSPTPGTRELTGRHVLFIMVAFFSVVIAVNLTMAFFARTSWTGFVVENIYIASRDFNGKAAEDRAQAALGWTPELVISGGNLRFRLTDRSGKPISAKAATVYLRRPAHASEDQEVSLTPQADGSLSAPVTLLDGTWNVEVRAETGLAHPYRDKRRVMIRDGAIQ